MAPGSVQHRIQPISCCHRAAGRVFHKCADAGMDRIVIALGYGSVAEGVLARSVSPCDNAVRYWRGCMVLYCRPKASPRRCLIHQGCSQLSTNNQRREPSGSDLRGLRLDWPGAHRSSFHDMRTGSSVMCQERIASNFLCAVTQFIPAGWPPSGPRRRTPQSWAHRRVGNPATIKTLMPFVRMKAANSCPGVSIPGWRCSSGFPCLRANSAVFLGPPESRGLMLNTTVPSESMTFCSVRTS